MKDIEGKNNLPSHVFPSTLRVYPFPQKHVKAPILF